MVFGPGWGLGVVRGYLDLGYAEMDCCLFVGYNTRYEISPRVGGIGFRDIYILAEDVNLDYTVSWFINRSGGETSMKAREVSVLQTCRCLTKRL